MIAAAWAYALKHLPEIAVFTVIGLGVIYVGGLKASNVILKADKYALTSDLETEVGKAKREKKRYAEDREAFAKSVAVFIQKEVACNSLVESLQAASDRHANAMAESVRHSEINLRAAELKAIEAANAVAAAVTCEEREAAFLKDLELLQRGIMRLEVKR